MLDVFAPYKWQALLERWPDILSAFGTTVGISALALVIALALGILFGVLSVSRVAVLRGVVRAYVEVVQNVPLLLQVFRALRRVPASGAVARGVLDRGAGHRRLPWRLHLRSGAQRRRLHPSRAVRGPRKARGSRTGRPCSSSSCPQALRIIMPPLAVQAANLVKNTSVLALIAGGELMYFSNSFAGATSYYGPVYVVAALLYFAVCFPLSRLALYLERRTRAHRHLATGDATEELGEDPLEVTPGTHDITGRAAAEALAGGVGTMFETVDIAPARRAPSPRHPLHVLGEGAGRARADGAGVHRARGGRDRRRDRARDRPGDRRGMRRRRGVRRARHAHEGRPREGAPTARAARGRAPGPRRGCGIGERRRARDVRRRRGGSARLRGEGRLALGPGRRGARLARRDGCERPHQQRGAPPRRPGRRGAPCRRRVPRQRRRARIRRRGRAGWSCRGAARRGRLRCRGRGRGVSARARRALAGRRCGPRGRAGPKRLDPTRAELEEEAARAEREADRAAREAEGASRGKEIDERGRRAFHLGEHAVSPAGSRDDAAHLGAFHRVLDRAGHRGVDHAHLGQPRAARRRRGLHRAVQEHPASAVDHVHVLRGTAAAHRRGRARVHPVHQCERGRDRARRPGERAAWAVRGRPLSGLRHGADLRSDRPSARHCATWCPRCSPSS